MDAPRRSDVAGGFEHGAGTGGPRVEGRRPARAVEGDGQAAQRGPEPQDGGVQPGPAHGPRADEMVVALVDGPATAHVRRGEQCEELVALGADGRVLDRRRERAGLGLEPVARRVLREVADGDRSDLLLVVERAQEARVRDHADLGAVELPAGADLLDGGEALRGDDRHHPLLALGDHDLDRLEIGLAQRDTVEVHVDPGPSTVRHLGQGGGEPGGAEILEGLDEAALDQLEARLDQLLAGERVADLHGGALVLVLVGELLARQDAGPADPVAARGGAVEHDEVAGAARLGARKPLGGQEPDAHRVDERVRLVRVVEHRFAADRGDADAVAVVPDPAHGAVEVEARTAEAEPVEERDGRAPMATMSRRIPPTPVAAPWNGSTAEGWL